MIEALKNEDIINKIGGRFKLTALVQKRWRELMLGARPMVEPEGLTPLEVAITEIVEGKVAPLDAGAAREEEADES
jgi:DNA-directed RNA polymerase subunit omega